MNRTVALVADNTLDKIGFAVISNDKVVAIKLTEPYRTGFERFLDYFTYTIKTSPEVHVMMAPKPAIDYRGRT